MTATGGALVKHVVTFGRVLREAGLEVGPGRLTDALRALDNVDLSRQEDVYFSLRQTLVSRHDELALFDRAFMAWFLRAPVLPPARVANDPQAIQRATDLLVDRSDPDGEDGEGDQLELGASGHELLREQDFAEMTPDEFRRVRRLMAALAERRPRRASRRRTPSARGDRLDMRRLIRQSLRTGGDPVDRPLRAQANWCRASWSCSATSPARWTRTRGR